MTMKQPVSCTQTELVDELNRMLAEEVEASLRYMHLMMVIHPQEERIMTLLNEAYDETIEHAQMVGERIREVGGLPRLDIRLGLPGEPIPPREALAQVLTFEEAALEGYQELLDRVRKAGGDAEMIEFLSKQVELETEHVEMFRNLLNDE
ncbi:MAG: hypothetical protein BIFFINMI_02955 [Phycisphaerae bacterium]|nr:hypothetical protein [Phycisphaerae bacterium]